MDNYIYEPIIKDGVKYYRLFCKCPVCTEYGRPVPPTHWHHEKCGGDIYMGEDARLYCATCEDSVHLNNVLFKCPLCSNVAEECADFLSDSAIGSTNNLAIIVGNMPHVVGLKFLQNLLKYL